MNMILPCTYNLDLTLIQSDLVLFLLMDQDLDSLNFSLRLLVFRKLNLLMSSLL